MRSKRLWSCLLGASMTATLCAAAGPALAQPAGLALDRFDPAPAGDRMFGVPSPYAAGDLTPHVMLLVDYAHDPLVLAQPCQHERRRRRQEPALPAPRRRPLALEPALPQRRRARRALQSGDSPTRQRGGARRLHLAEHGAVRRPPPRRARAHLGRVLRPLPDRGGRLRLAPDRAQGLVRGHGKVRGLPQLILGGRVAERVVWSAAARARDPGPSAFGGVGQGTMFELGRRRRRAAARRPPPPDRGRDLAARRPPRRAEAHHQRRAALRRPLPRHRRPRAGLGAGPGLTSGIGTPDFRGVFIDRVHARAEARPRPRRHRRRRRRLPRRARRAAAPTRRRTAARCADRDGDGIPDDGDACPDVKGVADPRSEEERLPAPIATATASPTRRTPAPT